MTSPGEALPVLQTDRLVLRPTRPADAEMLFPIFGDPVAMHYWDVPVRRDVQQTEQMLRSYLVPGSGQQGTWCLIFRGELHPVGLIQYVRREACHRRAEVRYVLARRHWRQGLMSEALGAMLHYCFETLALHRLEATCEPDNLRAMALLERLSFRKEGLLRGRYFVEPSYRDVFLFSLLSNEWRALPEQFARLSTPGNIVSLPLAKSGPQPTRSQVPLRHHPGT